MDIKHICVQWDLHSLKYLTFSINKMHTLLFIDVDMNEKLYSNFADILIRY